MRAYMSESRHGCSKSKYCWAVRRMRETVRDMCVSRLTWDDVRTRRYATCYDSWGRARSDRNSLAFALSPWN